MTEATAVRQRDPITSTPSAGALLEQMATGNLYRKAHDARMNLTAWLNRHSVPEKDGLDAFERMIAYAGINTVSNEDEGYYADTFDVFDKSDNLRALVPEWSRRQFRKVIKGIGTEGSGERNLLTSDLTGLGTVMRPYVDDAQVRMAQLVPALPISEMVAQSSAIRGNSFRGVYLTEPTAAAIRMSRVAEGAEIPRVTITTGQHDTRLLKYGRGVDFSYEFQRRAPIDLVGGLIARIALQAESDKSADALDILINGDGNANTAATVYNLTTLDTAAVAGTLTLKGWLAFKLKFSGGYIPTSAIVQEAVALQIYQLNLGTANQPVPQIFGGTTPMNDELGGIVRLGISANAPVLKIVMFDRRLALLRLTEIGGDITESEKFINRQVNTIYVSDVDGWQVLDGSAARILNINA